MENNFIAVYENAVPPEECRKLIDFFENCEKLGFVVSRQQHDKVSKLNKHDDSLFISSLTNLIQYQTSLFFTSILRERVYPKYAEEYDILAANSSLGIFEMKLQRTQIGGGYHMWHCEQGNRSTGDRVLTFTCYLNDVDEGGETEFLYYPKRIKAKEGTFVLFPGSFTHTHRGNPPISNTKYIVTGWLQFCD